MTELRVLCAFWLGHRDFIMGNGISRSAGETRKRGETEGEWGRREGGETGVRLFLPRGFNARARKRVKTFVTR